MGIERFNEIFYILGLV